MTLEYACILPHGSDIIPQLATRKTERLFERTRESVRRIAKDIREVGPQTIVIASPHNLRLQDNIGIVTTENSSGHLKGPRGRKILLSLKCDREFAKELLQKTARKGLPVVGANYGTAEGSASDMTMDWGTLIPLWFVFEEERVRSKIVIVTPSREIPLKKNIAFGKAIGDLAEQRKERVVFIASADQAHTHSKSGPYGYHRSASKYDEYVCSAIERNAMGSISRLGKKFVDDAKPDSLWQMAMLVGLTQVVSMKASLLSYEVPTYYGMICASFTRNES
jgi:aromatic ring-opening dioxygenase LigB subunit